MQKKSLIAIVLVSFPLNLLWENLHVSLYTDERLSMQRFLLLCTVADVLITLLIYITVSLLLRDQNWIRGLSWRRTLLVLWVSVLSAIVLEKLPLLWSWWGYSTSMPVLPWVRIGLSPFLQISLLPIATCLLVSLFSRTGRRM